MIQTNAAHLVHVQAKTYFKYCLCSLQESEKIRNFLNRFFLIFPQHALADGLIELCKNHIVAEVFERYYINTYKSPVASNLLLPHYTALILIGIVFIVLNYIIESGIYAKIQMKIKGAIQKRKSEYVIGFVFKTKN